MFTRSTLSDFMELVSIIALLMTASAFALAPLLALAFNTGEAFTLAALGFIGGSFATSIVAAFLSRIISE